MKYFCLIILPLLFACKSTEDQQNIEQIFTIEMVALSKDGKSISLNVSYAFSITDEQLQKCGYGSKEELDRMIIQIELRSVIRSYIGEFNENEMDNIDKETVKKDLNKALMKGMILNGEIVSGCPVSLSLFAMTRRSGG